MGSRPGNPSCLEHENIENIHSEWTSVVFAFPGSTLPSPGNKTSFFLGELAKERKANPSTLFGSEPPLASWFQALTSPQAHFLHHSDWFREGLMAQGDSVRLRSVPLATIIGKETLFLPAVTNLWM